MVSLENQRTSDRGRAARYAPPRRANARKQRTATCESTRGNAVSAVVSLDIRANLGRNYIRAADALTARIHTERHRTSERTCGGRKVKPTRRVLEIADTETTRGAKFSEPTAEIGRQSCFPKGKGVGGLVCPGGHQTTPSTTCGCANCGATAVSCKLLKTIDIPYRADISFPFNHLRHFR